MNLLTKSIQEHTFHISDQHLNHFQATFEKSVLSYLFINISTLFIILNSMFEIFSNIESLSYTRIRKSLKGNTSFKIFNGSSMKIRLSFEERCFHAILNTHHQCLPFFSIFKMFLGFS